LTTAELNIFVRIRAAEAQRQLAQLRTQLAVLEAQTARANATSNRPWFVGMSAAGSRLQWIGRQIATNLTAPILLATGFAVKWGLENERAMGQVAKVYGDGSQSAQTLDNELKALDASFTQLSNRFGVAKKDTIEIAAGWAAAGSSGLALARQTELTMKTMVIGELEAAEATQDLIAIQAQYGLDTQGLIDTVEQLNAVENQSGSTMKGLIQGFARAAGVARTAGVDTAHLAAMISALTPAAGSANEAGNALKTIMSRLIGPTGEARDVMQAMGIDVEATSWQALTATERMEFMAKSFEGLTNPQKGVASALIASRWQINKFEVAMREMASTTGYYAKSLDVLKDKQAVHKIAENELMTVLSTSASKVDQSANIIKNSLTEAFLPVIPVFVLIMQWFAKVGTAFQNLDPNLRLTIIVVGLVAAALGPLIIMMGLTKLAIGQLAPMFIFLGRAALLPLAPFRLVAAGMAAMWSAMIIYTRVGIAAIASGFGSFRALLAGIGAYQILMARVRLAAEMAFWAAFRGLAAAQMGLVLLAQGAWYPAMLTLQRNFHAGVLAAQRAYAAAYLAASIALHAVLLKASMIYNAAWSRVASAGYALQVTLTRVFAATSIALHVAWNAAMLTLNAGFWATWNALQQLMWRTQATIQSAYSAVQLAIQSAWNAASLALTRAYWVTRGALEVAGHGTIVLLQRAGGALLVAAQRATAALMAVNWAALWVRLVAITRIGTTGLIAALKTGMKRLALFLVSPIGLAIAAVVLLLVAFKDQIAGAVRNIVAYFRNLPAGVAEGLSPIGKIFIAIRDLIVRVFNSLPESIKNALIAVVRIVKAAALKVYELFSYLNPFAHHSPSLVENVTEGMNVVGEQFEKGANRAESAISNMYASMQKLNGAASGFMLTNQNAKEEETRGKIKEAGGGAALPEYDRLREDLKALKVELDAANSAVEAQQGVVDSTQKEIDQYDKSIKQMNKTLDALKAAQDAASDAVDRAREQYERFSNAQISGTQAASDEVFKNEMAQKKLQLQIKKMTKELTDEAGGVDSVTDAYSRLQGQIETLMGKQSELRSAGAGSDILSTYQDQIDALMAQQDALGGLGGSGTGIVSGPAAEVAALQDALEKLQDEAETLDLENALKFDPLNRELDKMKNKVEELPFATIVAGLMTSEAQINITTGAYDAATAAVDAQNLAIEAAQAQRDLLGERLESEQDTLDGLRGKYEEVETAISDGEKALTDFTTAAEETLSRIEEAARKAKEAAGSEDYISPGLQNFMDAGAGDFPDPGGGATIGREGGNGDQSAEIDEFTKNLADEVAAGLGGMDMFKPFKDGWQKVVDWWGQSIAPLGQPLTDMFGGIGASISSAFSGDGNEKLSTFAQWIKNIKDFLSDAWNTIVGFGQSLGDLFGPDLQSTISEVVAGFQDMWGKIQPQLKELWDTLGPALKNIFTILGPVITVVIGAIVGIIEILWEMFNGAIRPIFNFIGTLIESVIGVINGVIQAISGFLDMMIGVVTIIKGVFTLDWETIKAGFSQLVTGIGNILGGLWDIVWAIVDSVVSLFKNMGQLVWNVVYGFVKGVIDFFMWLWDELVGHSIVPDTINAIFDWFTQLPGRILDLVIQFVTWVIEWFISLPGRIMEGLGNLGELLGGWVSSAWHWVTEQLPGYLAPFNDFMGGIPGKILGVLGDGGTVLVDFGKNIIQGLLNGAGSLLSKIGEFFLDKLPGWIREPFKKAMGIESPSKVFAEYGRNTGEGFIQGLDTMAPAVAAASQAMADQASGISMPSLDVAVAATATVTDTPDAAISAAAGPVDPVAAMSATMDASAAAFKIQWDAFSSQTIVDVNGLTTQIQASYTLMHDGIIASVSDMTVQVQGQTLILTTNTQTAFNTLYTSVTTIVTNMSTGTVALITTMVAQIMAQMLALKDQLLTLMTEATTGVNDLWTTLGQSMATTLTDQITPVFDAFGPLLQTLEESFAETVDNVGTIWSGIEEKTAVPARFVINEVYNDGIRGAWNKFNTFLGLEQLPEHIAAFATGGKVWGEGTETSDSILARLSKNEHVVTAREVKGAGGHAAVEAQRAAWRYNSRQPNYARGGALPAFAFGGPVDQSLWAAASTAFPGATLNSAYRPGHSGYHGKGMAVDLGGPMQQIANWIFKTYPNSAQLIWDAGPVIAEGNTDQAYARNYFRDDLAGHRDHVHWASKVPISSDGKMVSTDGGSAGAAAMVNSIDMVREGIEASMKAVRDRLPGDIKGGIGQWPPKSVDKGETMLKDFLLPLAEKMQTASAAAGNVAFNASAGVEQWRSLGIEMLKKQGQSEAYIDRLLMQMQSESGGNPNALNDWDSNWAKGTPSKGLMQVIDPTFQSYRDPSLPNNIWDPAANIAASIRYTMGEYGSLNAWQGHGYDNGGLLQPGTQLTWNKTGGPEPVLTQTQWDAMYGLANTANTLAPDDIKVAYVNAIEEVYGLDPVGTEADAIKESLAEWNKSWTPAIFGATDALVTETGKTTVAVEKTATALDNFTETGGKIQQAVNGVSKVMLAISSAMSAQEQTFAAWAPVLDAVADLIGMIPDQERDWAADNPVPGETDAERKAREARNNATNTGKGLLQIFKDVAPVLLKQTSKIGTAIESLIATQGPIISAAIAMMPVNPIGGAIMLIPAILQGIFTILPLIIDAIIEIVPALIKAIMKFLTQFMPDSVYAYEDLASAEAAVNTQLGGGAVAMGQGQRYPTTTTVQAPNTNAPLNINIYGDLTMPNVTNETGAQTFADQLVMIASNKS
jgi:TP901 family phage tail tape measure protein